MTDEELHAELHRLMSWSGNATFCGHPPCAHAIALARAAVAAERERALKEATDIASDRAKEWAGQVVGRRRSIPDQRRAARAVEAAEIAVLIHGRIRSGERPGTGEAK